MFSVLAEAWSLNTFSAGGHVIGPTPHPSSTCDVKNTIVQPNTSSSEIHAYVKT